MIKHECEAICHQNKLTYLWNAAINHVNAYTKAKLFMKHYRVQCSTVNCKTIHIYIVGFQVMETLLLEDDAKLEQARTRRAKTICWATARMYRLSSGWAWQSWQLHACGFWIMANTVEEASCRCPVESQHWAKGPQTSNSWVRIRFAPISSLGSKRARVQLSAYCMSHANPACRIKELFSCFHGDLSSSKWRTCQESQLRIMHADKYNAV